MANLTGSVASATRDSFDGKVFISDVHGQKDVLDFLSNQHFGLIQLVVENVCQNRYSKAVQETVHNCLLSEMAAQEVTCDALKAMVEVLIEFKHERGFWQACVEHFCEFEWMLTELDKLIRKPVDDESVNWLPSLEPRERTGVAIAIARVVRQVLHYRLNVVGDIYDRGADACAIMDALSHRDNVHIQWGNHDVVWLGAAAGSLACVATVVRICLRYGTVATLESDYGISLADLEQLAERYYGRDECAFFQVAGEAESESSAQPRRSAGLLAKMHKAIAIIQFKLEDHLLERNPQFDMDDRRLLHKLDVNNGTVELNGEQVPLQDYEFPTLDSHYPSALSDEEWKTIEALRNSFIASQKLSQHMEYLLDKGGMYAVDGDYVLFHGCVPLQEDKSFMAFEVAGAPVAGRALFSALELQIREAYARRRNTQRHHLADIAWYLWCGPASPLFGKEKMTTFERYFIADKQYHKEGKNPYFNERDNAAFIERVCEELGGPTTGVVVNGHVPVKVSSGETPIMANGHMICIDGGFAVPYRKVTGIAGMSLVHGGGAAKLYALQPQDKQFKLSDITNATDVVGVR